MPPQPLKSVRRNARAKADPLALRNNPALAAKIAEAIGFWARVESTLGNMLALMLKTGARVSMAMFGAIVNSRIQLDVIESAARVTLPPEDFEIFGALMVLVKRAGAKRHKLERDRV
jgi:hypothetical protein